MILDARKVITANILVKIAFAKNVKTATTITGKGTILLGWPTSPILMPVLHAVSSYKNHS